MVSKVRPRGGAAETAKMNGLRQVRKSSPRTRCNRRSPVRPGLRIESRVGCPGACAGIAWTRAGPSTGRLRHPAPSTPSVHATGAGVEAGAGRRGRPAPGKARLPSWTPDTGPRRQLDHWRRGGVWPPRQGERGSGPGGSEGGPMDPGAGGTRVEAGGSRVRTVSGRRYSRLGATL